MLSEFVERTSPEQSSERNYPRKVSDREFLELAWRVKGSAEGRSHQSARHQETSADQFQKEHSQPKNSQKKYSVLIVDDDNDSLLVAQYLVEALGYVAVPIVSGHSVIETTLSCRPDIILLDIRLDGINGVDVFQRLQQHKQLAGIPVIAVTALSQPSARSSVMAAGFSDFILKPYLADELDTVLSAYLPQSSNEES